MKVHPALKKATRKVALPLAFMIAITSMMMGFFVIPSYAEDGATPSAEPAATVVQKEAPAEEKPTVTPTESEKPTVTPTESEKPKATPTETKAPDEESKVAPTESEKPATTPTETETSTKASKVTPTKTPTEVSYKPAKDYITYKCTNTGLEVQVAEDAPNLRLSWGSSSKDVSAQETPIIEPIPATLTVTVIDEPSNSDVVTIKCGTDPTPPIKVFVCKYIGKPGVDERLQTGNNPISVSVNAIPDYKGPGSYFADAQGRSFVLEVDNGQAEPSISKCPAPEGPPDVVYVVPDNPTKVDLCEPVYGPSPDGINIPEADMGYYTIDGKKVSAGFNAVAGTSAKVVFVPIKDVEIKEGATSKWTFEFTKEKCPVVLTKVTAVNGSFTDLCGPDFNLGFTPAVTEGVEYVQVREGNTLTVTAKVTDPAKYELTNPNWSQTKTDELVKCPVVLTKVTAVDGKFVDLCGLDYNLTFTPVSTEGVEYVQVREGNTLKVTAQVTDAKKYELTNPEWSQTATDELVKCPVVLQDLGFKKFESRTCTKVEKKLTISNPNDSQANVFVNLPDTTPPIANFLLEGGKSKTVSIPKSATVVQILAYPGATLDDAFYFEEVPFSVTSVKDCSSDDNGAPGEDNGDQPFVPAVVPAVMPDQPANNWLAAAFATALALAFALGGAWQLGLVKVAKK